MIIGIDASNISKGGGLTHLIGILEYMAESKDFLSKIYVWSNKSTLKKIKNNKDVVKMYSPVLDKSIFYRILWQKFKLPILLKQNNCDILFVPGGPTSTSYIPKVTMSRNLHPFVNKELFRLPLFSFMMLKYVIIRISQPFLFKKFQGIIFLNQFAKNTMINIIGEFNSISKVIPHGVNNKFRNKPRVQKKIKDYSDSNKFNILYVSKIDVHKHQSKVAKAILNLHKKKYPVHITFIGPIDSESEYLLFKKVIASDTKSNEAISYLGNTDYKYLPELYKKADLFVFASSCENMPNIMLEAMASGLPLACSSFGPMPHVLKDGGVYFNPESETEIEKAIEKLLLSKELREDISSRAYKISQAYSWKRCSKETFQFINDINKKSKDGLYKKQIKI